MPWGMRNGSSTRWSFSRRVPSLFRAMPRICAAAMASPSMISCPSMISSRRFLPDETLLQAVAQGSGSEPSAGAFPLRSYPGPHGLRAPASGEFSRVRGDCGELLAIGVSGTCPDSAHHVLSPVVGLALPANPAQRMAGGYHLYAHGPSCSGLAGDAVETYWPLCGVHHFVHRYRGGISALSGPGPGTGQGAARAGVGGCKRVLGVCRRPPAFCCLGGPGAAGLCGG